MGKGLCKWMTGVVLAVSGILILFFLLLIRSMNEYTRPKGPDEICIHGLCMKRATGPTIAGGGEENRRRPRGRPAPQSRSAIQGRFRPGCNGG